MTVVLPIIRWDGTNLGDVTAYIVNQSQFNFPLPENHIALLCTVEENISLFLPETQTYPKCVVSTNDVIRHTNTLSNTQWYPRNKDETCIFIFKRKKSHDGIECVIDELKLFFNIKKNGRHRAKIGKKEWIFERSMYAPFSITAYKETCNIQKINIPIPAITVTYVSSSLSTFMKDDSMNCEHTPYFMDYIRRIYMFRYALGLTRNNDFSLEFRIWYCGGYDLVSSKEVSATYDDDKKIGSKITDSCVKRWFNGKWTNVTLTMRSMFTDLQLQMLRVRSHEMISKLDHRYVIWSGIISRRIRERMTD